VDKLRIPVPAVFGKVRSDSLVGRVVHGNSYELREPPPQVILEEERLNFNDV
jgi:hypothetical protein